MLNPSFPLLEERAGTFTFRGIVGTVDLGAGRVLDIAPKIRDGDDWITAVLDLLLPTTRISIAGDRRGGLSAHRSLLEVLAAIYADRLTRALRRDGPLLLMERRADTLTLLRGKLNTTRWARQAAWTPHRLPQAFQELTADNTFTRAMASVALTLAQHSRDPQVRGRLLTASRELRPGAPVHAPIAPGAASQVLPPQWGAYQPAWDVAVSVLSRTSLLGASGTRRGVSLVVEAWRLLETLLERSLHDAVRIAHEHMFDMQLTPKAGTPLLKPAVPGRGSRTTVEPDGRLATPDGRTVATFEAKYSGGKGQKPKETHVYQALAAAAACRSPLAVLAYPDSFHPVAWNVEGFGGRPAQLVTIGLGLYRYRRGAGDRERGHQVYDLLVTAGQAPISVERPA